MLFVREVAVVEHHHGHHHNPGLRQLVRKPLLVRLDRPQVPRGILGADDHLLSVCTALARQKSRTSKRAWARNWRPVNGQRDPKQTRQHVMLWTRLSVCLLYWWSSVDASASRSDFYVASAMFPLQPLPTTLPWFCRVRYWFSTQCGPFRSQRLLHKMTNSRRSFYSSSSRLLNVKTRQKTQYLLSFVAVFTDQLAQRINRNITCAQGNRDVHSRWNFTWTFTEFTWRSDVKCVFPRCPPSPYSAHPGRQRCLTAPHSRRLPGEFTATSTSARMASSEPPGCSATRRSRGTLLLLCFCCYSALLCVRLSLCSCVIFPVFGAYIIQPRALYNWCPRCCYSQV